MKSMPQFVSMWMALGNSCHTHMHTRMHPQTHTHTQTQLNTRIINLATAYVTIHSYVINKHITYNSSNIHISLCCYEYLNNFIMAMF